MIGTTLTNEAVLKEAAKQVIATNMSVGKAPKNLDGLSKEEIETLIANAAERVNEESGELTQSKNIKKHADALCDIFVTVVGLRYAVALATNEPTYELSTGVVGEVNLTDKINLSVTEMDTNCNVRYLDSIYYEVCKQMIDFAEVDCIGFLWAVIRNNNSKFPKTLMIAQESLEWYKTNTHESEIVIDELIGKQGYWLRRVSDNKYMKPKPFYKDVDITPFIRNFGAE